jgi:nitrogen fixation NifU-like protein
VGGPGDDLFSPTVLDHFENPRNAGELPAPSGEGWAGSMEAGRFLRYQVRLAADRIEDLRYATYGCVPAIAAGSLLGEWARGRTVEEALSLSAETLVQMLGGLPRRRRFCADLAVEALHRALRAARGEEKA